MSIDQDESRTATSFSERVRSASWASHRDAEGATFMQDLFAGAVTQAGYAELVVQQWFAYEVLERASEAMRDDPVAGRFVFSELTRRPALETDLTFLLGANWHERVQANRSTQEYCDRLTDVAFSWPGGFVAHHYVRYLGDLSGGQVIRGVIERTYGLEGDGVRFYHFAEIDDPDAFKVRYRGLLDDTPWDTEEQERIIGEVLEAYRQNTALLMDLGSSTPES